MRRRQPITESSFLYKRKYKDNDSIVVKTRSPKRDRILKFVNENKRVSLKQLRRFILGLNENSSSPAATTSMWIKRNKQFFIFENRNGREIIKLSNLGRRTLEKSLYESDHDFVDDGKPGIYDSDNSDNLDVAAKEAMKKAHMSEEELEEIEKKLENGDTALDVSEHLKFKLKRAMKLLEAAEDDLDEIEKPPS